jgi:hypothetical protein
MAAWLAYFFSSKRLGSQELIIGAIYTEFFRSLLAACEGGWSLKCCAALTGTAKARHDSCHSGA